MPPSTAPVAANQCRYQRKARPAGESNRWGEPRGGARAPAWCAWGRPHAPPRPAWPPARGRRGCCGGTAAYRAGALSRRWARAAARPAPRAPTASEQQPRRGAEGRAVACSPGARGCKEPHGLRRRTRARGCARRGGPARPADARPAGCGPCRAGRTAHGRSAQGAPYVWSFSRVHGAALEVATPALRNSDWRWKRVRRRQRRGPRRLRGRGAASAPGSCVHGARWAAMGRQLGSAEGRPCRPTSIIQLHRPSVRQGHAWPTRRGGHSLPPIRKATPACLASQRATNNGAGQTARQRRQP
ncbi:MAG: hypothetical protein J3K34DRAFT_148783 [Monoraphidium minutum]|nr:MAG: hypothetical protein J3K34DRAFT_148783 [Monoraphidium minutum]